MSQLHTDIWSHPGHYLVDPYIWPWSPNGHGHGHEWPYSHPLCSMSIGPPILRYSYFKIWSWTSLVKAMHVVKGQDHICPWKFKGQGHGQGQTHWSHLRPGVQSICLLFVSWQSGHFWLRYSNFHIWPWKFEVNIIAKVKTWWSHLRPKVQSICLLFISWQFEHFWQRYSKFHIWPWKFKRPRVQSICLLFVSWQSDHLCLRYSKFHIWPWKFKVKVTTKINQNLIR